MRKNQQLYEACKHGDYSGALEAIQKGANAWNNGLYGACSGNHRELVELTHSLFIFS